MMDKKCKSLKGDIVNVCPQDDGKIFFRVMKNGKPIRSFIWDKKRKCLWDCEKILERIASGEITEEKVKKWKKKKGKKKRRRL